MCMYASCAFTAHEGTGYIYTESAWASALLILCWWAMRRPELWDKRQVQFPRLRFYMVLSIHYLFFIKTLCVGNLQALNNVICKKLILFPQHGFGLIFGRRFCFLCYALQLFLVATNCVWYSPKDRKDLPGSRLTKYG